MPIVTVYTAILGGHDNLRPPIRTSEHARFICYVDEMMPAADPWEFRPAWCAVHGDPSRNVRIHKALPYIFTDNTEYSIWVDANFQMAADPMSLLHEHLQGADIALFGHPCRDCAYDEADVCRQDRLEEPEILDAQVARYRDDGLPRHAGLWACGIILRRNSSTMREFGQAWWKEVLNSGRRDQVSFAYLAWKLGLRINTIPGNVFENPLFVHHRHGASAHEENDPFREQRAEQDWRRWTLKRLSQKEETHDLVHGYAAS